MREQGLHRLPVIENDQLVGLVTEGTIGEASPSKATSLSIYEMNYLNKTKVRCNRFEMSWRTGYASLEDATYPRLKIKLGYCQSQTIIVYGVITDHDVFQAFWKSPDMEKRGLPVSLSRKQSGVLKTALIVEEDLNISPIRKTQCKTCRHRSSTDGKSIWLH